MLLLSPEFQSHHHEDAVIATRDIKTQDSMKEPVQKTPCQQELWKRTISRLVENQIQLRCQNLMCQILKNAWFVFYPWSTALWSYLAVTHDSVKSVSTISKQRLGGKHQNVLCATKNWHTVQEFLFKSTTMLRFEFTFIYLFSSGLSMNKGQYNCYNDLCTGCFLFCFVSFCQQCYMVRLVYVS